MLKHYNVFVLLGGHLPNQYVTTGVKNRSPPYRPRFALLVAPASAFRARMAGQNKKCRKNSQTGHQSIIHIHVQYI